MLYTFPPTLEGHHLAMAESPRGGAWQVNVTTKTEEVQKSKSLGGSLDVGGSAVFFFPMDWFTLW